MIVNEEHRLKAKSQMRQMLGLHGIAGVVEILAEVCEEFGEGRFGGKPIKADPFWMEASAYIDKAADELKELVARS